MCHDDWVIDGISPAFVESMTLVSGEEVQLSGEVRIVFRREPLPA